MTAAPGLVVAGGQGSRMARSGADRPKPLMEVAGVSLVERSLTTLLRHDLRDLYVAVAATDVELAEHVETRCRPLVESAGGRLTTIRETSPLGSIGATALVAGTPEEVLVVNADNVTALDLRDLLAAHRRRRPALTIAVHDEPFHMPFGEVTTDGDRVVSYVEKPTYHVTVSSAVTVVGRAALGLIEPGSSWMLPALVQEALARSLPVLPYRHRAPWVDVNDLDALARAEELVAAHPGRFEGADRG